MIERLLNKYGIKQVGYYVEDMEKSAQYFHDLLGAGPFVDMGESSPAKMIYNGDPNATMRVRCCLGNLGDMQMELIQVVSDGPTVYSDLGHYGLHHLCFFSDDPEQVEQDFAEAGIGIAMQQVSGQGLKVTYYDARKELGSFIEVYAPNESLYAAVKALADNADENTPALVSLEVLLKNMGR